MRRQIPIVFFFLALLFLALGQAISSATPRGEESEYAYLPLVANIPTVTPTATATPAPTMTPLPTATSVPQGSGVYRNDFTHYYPNFTGTKAFGFVRFFDGGPAFGGPNNYHVWVCFNGGQGCFRSSDLDGTGYYDMPINGFPAQPIRASGYAWVTHGLVGQEQRVSQNFPFDTNNGTCWRMDFIECTEGSTDPQCSLPNAHFAAIASAVEGADSVQGTCPP
jgi:hypothetical protein